MRLSLSGGTRWLEVTPKSTTKGEWAHPTLNVPYAELPAGDAAANGCPTGCPAFFAYGSVLDNQTNDPTTLEPQYLQPLTNNAITCIYSPDVAACKSGTTIHRAVKHQF